MHKFGITFPTGLWAVVASSRRWYQSTSTVMTFIVPGYEHASSESSTRLDGIRLYGAYIDPATTVWTYPAGKILVIN